MNEVGLSFMVKEIVMLLQAALTAMLLSAGIVIIELRRIDDRYNEDQAKISYRLNNTSDRLDYITRANRDLHAINEILYEDVNNLNSTIENHNKQLEFHDGEKEK